NSTINGNTAGSPSSIGYGGGIRNYGPLTLNNSTVSGNIADGTGNSPSSGGGIYNASFGTVNLNNTTIVGNSSQDAGGIFNHDYYEGRVTMRNTILAGNTAGAQPGNCTGPISSAGYNLVEAQGCSFTQALGD